MKKMTLSWPWKLTTTSRSSSKETSDLTPKCGFFVSKHNIHTIFWTSFFSFSHALCKLASGQDILWHGDFWQDWERCKGIIVLSCWISNITMTLITSLMVPTTTPVYPIIEHGGDIWVVSEHDWWHDGTFDWILNSQRSRDHLFPHQVHFCVCQRETNCTQCGSKNGLKFFFEINRFTLLLAVPPQGTFPSYFSSWSYFFCPLRREKLHSMWIKEWIRILV